MQTGKSNIKSVIVIVILVLVGVLGVLGMNTAKTYLSGASADYEPKNVRVDTEGGKATISWSTDKPAMGVIEYGTTPASLLLRYPETTEMADHKVTIEPLKGNTSYYFRIRIGEEVYDNSGIPYSFKTKDLVTVESDKESKKSTGKVSTPALNSGGDTCKYGVDYNKDGVVNGFDVAFCKKGTGSETVGGNPTEASSKCKNNVDYDGNGVVNSFDMIKCLKS